MAEPARLVLVDGANQLSGVRALWWVWRHWPDLRREMSGSPGFIAYRLWFEWPLTVGLTTWWADEKSAYRFAHQPVHLQFWRWGTDSRHTRGGWLALYRHDHGGPLWGTGVEAMMRRLGHQLGPAPGKPAKPPQEDRLA